MKLLLWFADSDETQGAACMIATPALPTGAAMSGTFFTEVALAVFVDLHDTFFREIETRPVPHWPPAVSPADRDKAPPSRTAWTSARS